MKVFERKGSGLENVSPSGFSVQGDGLAALPFPAENGRTLFGNVFLYRSLFV